MAPHLPAPPQLHRGEHEDEDQDRVRTDDDEGPEPEQPDDPERGMERGDGSAAVERDDGEQVEEIDEEAEEGDRLELVGVLRDAERVDRRRAKRADDRAGQRDPRLVPGVARVLLHRDHRAEERDEHRRADGQALSPRLDHVAHLVHEEQHDQPGREPRAADPEVEAERDEDREEELRLEEDRPELCEERAGRRDRRPESAQDVAPAPLGLHRVVLVVLGRLVGRRRLPLLLLGQIGRLHRAHGSCIGRPSTVT